LEELMLMDREKLYELVKKSPELVDRHDREGWLGLFSSEAVVEDPVGGGLNRKGKDWRGDRDGLSRFYDIFIAPNDIKFTVNQDIVMGNEVVRDVLIRTRLPNGAVSEVAAYLIYRGVEEGGEVKLASLQAHWDFKGNAMRLLRNNGLKGIAASAGQFWSMLRIQGLKRVMLYLGAMYKGIFKKGIVTVNSFAAAVNAGDEAGLARLCEPDARIEYPAGKRTPASDFLKAEGKGRRLEVSGLRSAGWYTSCVFDAQGGGAKHHGVVFFQFNPKSKKIVSTWFFWNE
jgi:ketosteroid isomerase-like protein